MWKSNVLTRFTRHDKSRICQGDILRDAKLDVIDVNSAVLQITYPYMIVLSQDCDLEQSNSDRNGQPAGIITNNQYLPNILIAPCFLGDSFRSGDHLVDAFNIKQDRLNSERWGYVKQNRDQRYHFIKGQTGDLPIPDLVLDFKHYLTLPFESFILIHKICYIASVSELFREELSLRFCNYLSRIGLPELP